MRLGDAPLVGAPIVVFLGPTCSRAEAATVVDARFQPPAKKGDFYRLLATDVAVIVLIDGVFHGVPSVWHREILAAVDEGVAVIGASSMGALRASELHDLGVEGHGTIFEWYRDGIIDGDDEVALHHGPEDSGYVALSEPLVNIRATLLAAAEAGHVTAAQAAELIEEARATHYPDRSFRRLLASPIVRGWPSPDREALAGFIEAHRVDLKKRDALGALERARSLADTWHATPRRPPRASPRAPSGFDDERLMLRQFGGGGERARHGHAVLAAAERSGRVSGLVPLVSSRWFTLSWAEAHGIEFPAEEVLPIARRREARHAGEGRDAFLRRNALTASEYAAWLDREARFEWLLERGPERFGVDWDGERAAAAELALGEPADPCVRAARGFLAGWARAHGIACPEAEADALWARWQAAGAPAPADTAAWRDVIRGLALARWLAASTPEAFGYPARTTAAAVVELQATDRIAELLSA